MTDICVRCEKEKPISDFVKDKAKLNGYRCVCKNCRRIHYLKNKKEIRENQKEYYQKNKEHLIEKQKKYSKNHKEEIKESGKLYREKNKDSIKEKKKKYAKDNSEKISSYFKQYCKDNKDSLREKTRIRRNKRRKTDPNYRVLGNLRKRIYDALNGKCKSARSIELLGCTIEEYRIYLSSKFQDGMTWENYGRGGWSIDHIIPCDSFDLSEPEQQLQCFNYLNTQPLWERDNIAKGNNV